MTWEEAVLWLRSQPDEGDLVRACFFDDPLLDAANRYRASSEWRAMTRFLPAAPGLALDVGAGRGIVSYALARDGWRVVALEPDPSAVVGADAIRSLAAQAGLPIEVRRDWGENLPFDEGSFDLVVGRQVLHHARDLGRLCREANRVLRRGGVLIAAREHVISRREDLRAFLDAHPLHRYYGGENAYLLCEYRRAIEAAGFRLRRILNPWESDINLYPDSLDDVTRSLARSLHLPSRWLVPRFIVAALGARSDVPGRLFTFVCEKPRG